MTTDIRLDRRHRFTIILLLLRRCTFDLEVFTAFRDIVPGTCIKFCSTLRASLCLSLGLYKQFRLVHPFSSFSLLSPAARLAAKTAIYSLMHANEMPRFVRVFVWYHVAFSAAR